MLGAVLQLMKGMAVSTIVITITIILGKRLILLSLFLFFFWIEIRRRGVRVDVALSLPKRPSGKYFAKLL
jgi:hypothetical protein